MNETVKTAVGRTSLGIAALVAALGMVACSGGTTSPASTGGSGGGGGDSDPAGDREPSEPITITIDIWNRQFLPPGSFGGTLTMGVEQRVRWVNHDATPHRLSTVSVPDGGKPFSGYLAGRADEGEFVFDPRVKGVWEYVCQIHPQLMSNGRIVVR